MARAKETTLDRIRDDKKSANLKDLSFDDLLKQIEAEGELLDASQIGEGYHLLSGRSEKEKLVGVPFLITDYVLRNKGKYGDWVTLKIKTAQPIFFGTSGYTDFIINDGSTGIRDQVKALPNGTQSIVCRKGLRVSKDYEVTDDQGQAILDPQTNKPILGTTFYIDTSL